MEGDVQGELAKLAATPPTAQESEVALRSVQRLQKGNAELAKCDQNEMMQLYVAMKRARGETARISAVHMLGWRQRHVQTTLLKQNFYVVPRRGRENLLQDMKEYLVDPCDLPDLPVTFDPKESFILDDAAPRGKLGLGVTIMELSAGTQRDRSTSVPVQQAQKSVEGGDKVEALSAAARPMESVPVQAAALTERPSSRVLQLRHSEEMTEKDAAETIAENIKKAFDNGRLHSDDALAHNTVTFWLTRYQKHLMAQLQAFKKSNHEADSEKRFLSTSCNKFFIFVVWS